MRLQLLKTGKRAKSGGAAERNGSGSGACGGVALERRREGERGGETLTSGGGGALPAARLALGRGQRLGEDVASHAALREVRGELGVADDAPTCYDDGVYEH